MSDNKYYSGLTTLTKSNFKDWKAVIHLYCAKKPCAAYLASDKAATAIKAQLELWTDQKHIAAGVLQQAHTLWKLLCDHFEAKTVENQLKVYQNLLKIPFCNNLSTYMSNIDTGIANMRAVGMTIRVPLPTEPTVNENHLAEIIMSKIPSNYANTKDIIFTKQPLTLEIIQTQLDSKSLTPTYIRAFL
ncbi:hypothetical protein PTTG_25198 [Puccinia triticina 1-1 BBBD Race 1]|uniref:Uncharacterized protein n=1 Tax=Puccinia triticina (isolate 1-1 / race 1 (BBBD)) TaxID=630390 RepID=A0A180H6N5_PUCT1|nr:hypothetical protein PTTG_25198 [Puccinia triticina 1-1 BBBD Race 1]